MRARDRTEDQDQHHQDGAGRQRVAEQRERDVSAREPLRHDAGADDGREQEGRAERLGGEASRQRRHQVGATAFAGRAFHAADFVQPRCSVSWSRLRIGSAVKIAMRWCSIR